MTLTYPKNWNDANWWAQRTRQDIEVLRGRLKSSIRRWNIAHWLVCLASGMLATTLAFPLFGLSDFDAKAVAGGYGTFTALGVLLFVLLVVTMYKRDGRQSQLDSLQPLQSKVTCEYVLGLLREQRVRDYRDAVVRNRGTVLEVDRACMAAVAFEAAKAADDKRLEDARQMVLTFVPEEEPKTGAPA